MSTLVLNPTYQSFDILYKADLDSIRIPLQNFLNTTQLDTTNFAPGSLTQANLQESVQNALVQTGATQEYYGTTLPAGYIWCDGTTYPITQYPELFDTIAYQFGGTIGVNFTVPDRRGVAVAGRDNMGGTASGRLTSGVIGTDPTNNNGGIGGNENLSSHTHLINSTFNNDTSHVHTVIDPFHTHSGISDGVVPGPTTAPTDYFPNYPQADTSQDIAGAFTIPISMTLANLTTTTGVSPEGEHSHGLTGPLDSAGTNPNLSLVQPSFICNYIIKL